MLQILAIAELCLRFAPRCERESIVFILYRYFWVEVLESLHEAPLLEVETAWDEEVERRLAAYDRGELQSVDGEEVLAKARRLVKQ